VLDENILEKMKQEEASDSNSIHFINKYEPISIDVIKQNINHVENTCLAEKICQLKEVEFKMRKNCSLNTDDLDRLAAQNLDVLKSYENELSQELEKVLNSEFLTYKDKSELNDLLKLNSFEPRLVLRSKLNKTNANLQNKIELENGVKSKCESLIKDLTVLSDKYEEKRKMAILECELIASDLEDCCVVYSK
jgi:hypothetical protein